jgi:hypothetical protein
LTLGEYDAARAAWTDTVRRGEETEQGHVMAWSRLQLGYIAAIREGDEEARRLVDSARESKEPLWYSGAGGAAWVLGVSALARGDGETAVALLANTDLDVSQAAYAPWTACGAPAAGFRLAPSCVRRLPFPSACAASPGSSAPRASYGQR